MLYTVALADQHKQKPPAFGQIIVKFASNAPVNAEIGTALEKGTATSNGIKDFIETLAQELEVPLRAGRITSGRELLIEIPYAGLLEQLHKHVHTAVGVTRAEVKINESDSSFYSSNEVIVDFDSKGEAYAIVSRVAAGNAGGEASLIALVASLSPTPLYALTTRVTVDKRLALTPDMNAITQAVTRALKARKDVEYAQPDYTLGTY